MYLIDGDEFLCYEVLHGVVSAKTLLFLLLMRIAMLDCLLEW